MKNIFVYCDESGNTGSNFIDPQQPFYVLASWWVDETKIPDCNNAIKSCLSLYSSSRGIPEIKGSSLTRSAHGQKSILSLFNDLKEIGAIPIYVIAEKKYCVAAKVVETLLDPVYNQSVSYTFWNDANFKQHTADIIYSLPDTVLTEYALAYRSLDQNALIKSANSIRSSLISISIPNLATLISGSIAAIPKIAHAEVTSGENIPGHAFYTLNMPIFVDFISRVELFARFTKVNEVSILHDSVPEFKETYDWAFNLYKNANKLDIPLSNGTVIPLGFQLLNNFNVADSINSPLIQAADLLANSLFYFVFSILSGKTIKSDLLNIGKLLLPATIREPQLGGLIISKNMINKLAVFIMG